ncbi:MAG: hypothetical protein A2287_00705 [Candidatus Melainabacteria bacterium RIFOXYA12_FULL_32_12]|nr:MAG: hypothetical protein A2287_00705 [Candidatus Melainabacteria bacterium RIFOXYA12_FULL_32_12]
MVGISKDLGTNSYQPIKHKNNQKNQAANISFKGAALVEDSQGRVSPTFFLPTAQNAKLEVVKLENGNATTIPVDKSSNNTDDSLKIWTPNVGIINPHTQILYRFKVNGKNYLDNTRKMSVNGNEYNVAPSISRANLTQPHQLYHLMPDNFNPPNKFNPDETDIRRNHFNKYDGTLNGITEKLDYIKDLGAARVISTPVIGQDQISSHGYWTTNPYQITSTLGTANDFKNLQVELFKRGMGWVSDGAFVNEGWEGIHLLDLLRHGNQSYAKNWFETFNFPNQKLKVGILPKDKLSNAHKNFDIKIINGPVKIGKLGPEPNDEYNPKKPTQIQLYDRRLVTEDQMYNQEEIRSYPVKNLKDPNEIKTYKDSVQPLTFDINPDEIQKKFDSWQNSTEDESFRDKLLQWSNFELVPSNESGGITLWDGNKDIAKLRFTNTEKAPQEAKSFIGRLFNSNKNERHEEINKAISQVQDYIVSVGGYWTNEVDKTLTEYTAKELGKKLGSSSPSLSTAQKADSIFTAIQELAQTQDPNKKDSKANILPEKVVDLVNNGQITKEHIKNLLESQYNPETKKYDGAYDLKTGPLPENILDGIMSYPLDAIEFPREICSILSSPHIKKLATNPDEVGQKSRYALMNDSEYDKMSSTYKKLDKVYQKNIVPIAKEIIKSSKHSDQLLNKDGDLSAQGQELFRLVADDIVKYIVIKSIADMKPSKESLENGLGLDYSDKNSPDNPYKTLHDKTYDNILYLSKSSPENAAETVVESLKDGLGRITQEDKTNLAKYLDTRLSNVDADLIKVSKLLLNKTESGLGWRIDAAKDIANIDSIKSKESSFEDALENMTKFWNKYFTEVRKYNPKSYIISEITDFDPLMDGKSHGRFKNPVDAERKFVEETGATTPTEYRYMFNGPSRMVHGGLEAEFGNANHYDNISEFMDTILIDGWGKDGTGILSGLIDQTNYAHVSPGNHDKSRLLHGFSLNIGEFFGYTNDIDEKIKNTFDSTMGADKRMALMKPIYDIYEKALGKDGDWYKNKTQNEKWSFIEENWQKDWIKNDPRIQKVISETEYNKKIQEVHDSMGKSCPQVQELIEYKNKLTSLDQTGQSAFVTAQALKQSVNKAFQDLPKELELSANSKQVLLNAIDELAQNKNKEYFARRAFSHNWEDIINKAKENSLEIQKFAKDESKCKTLETLVHKQFLTPALEKYKALTSILAVMPGNPTMYAGDELGETGMESPSKNIYLQNRNRLHWEYLNKEEHKDDFIRDFNKDISNNFNLRNDKRLSPLVNGHTIPLKKQQDKSNIYAMYRYNSEKDVIAVINNKGLNNTRDKYKVIPEELDKIDLSQDEKYGVPGGLKEGAKYRSINDAHTYMVKNNSIVRKDGGKIEVNEPTLILYREQPFTKSVPNSNKTEQEKPKTLNLNG